MPESGGLWLSPAGAALLAAAGAAALLLDTRREPAACDREEPIGTTVPSNERLQAFRHWLQARGCEVGGIEIRPCSENPQAGLAAYLTAAGESRLHPPLWRRPLSWLRGRPDAVLASFPLTNVISASALLADPQRGAQYSALLEKGLEERDLVILFLLVERLRGADSPWHPWLAALPASFSTPLFASDAELAELRGTPLERATQALRWQLWQTWQLLAPAADALLAGSGGSGRRPTFDDLLWAHSVFWSRSISFPEPAAGGGATPAEGLVPGLDCCNHDTSAPARWSVWNRASAQGRTPTAVALVTPPGARLAAGQEVCISYGDKSNEELLLQYGFTIDGNPDDMLMLRCPAPDEPEDSLAAKGALLQLRGLRPQLFLSGRELEAVHEAGGDSLALDERSREVLEVLTLPAAAAHAAAESLGHLSEAALARTRLELTGLSPARRCERRLAQLTLLADVLRAQLSELEEGTGPLEGDIRLLEAADSATPQLLASCIVYRASLKRLARGFLQAAEASLARERQAHESLLAAETSPQQPAAA